MKTNWLRWVYTIKNHKLFKARLVAKGYSQRPGIDFHDTWSPVPRMSTERTILAFAAVHDLEIEQMDVKCAYLNAPIDSDIYMIPPPGMDLPSGLVLKLKKGFYGIEQGARLWHDEFSNSLVSRGFKHLKCDDRVFVRGSPNDDDFVILIAYVDDILIIGKWSHVNSFKIDMAAEYNMTDLGPSRKFIGFDISRNRTSHQLTLSQHSFTEKIISTFPDTLYPSQTPYDPKTRLLPNSAQASPDFILQYQTAVGNLQHLLQGTRPDIAYSTSIASQFCANPNKSHWEAVVRIYSGTREVGITYSGRELNLKAFTDANHGGDITTNSLIPLRSINGYVFLIAGGAVAWKCQRQARVVPGSFDAEYLALKLASLDSVPLAYLMSEIGCCLYPVPIQIDNQSVIKASSAPKHALTKHVNIAYHIVKENYGIKKSNFYLFHPKKISPIPLQNLSINHLSNFA